MPLPFGYPLLSRHGGTGARGHGGGRGTVRLLLLSDRFTCEVTDHGRGFNTADYMPCTEPPFVSDTGGNEVWVVEQMAEFLLVDSGPAGTTIRIAPRTRDTVADHFFMARQPLLSGPSTGVAERERHGRGLCGEPKVSPDAFPDFGVVPMNAPAVGDGLDQVHAPPARLVSAARPDGGTARVVVSGDEA